MKTKRAFALLLVCVGLILGTSSCVALYQHDNGLHRGWYKQPAKSPGPVLRTSKPDKGKSPHVWPKKAHGKPVHEAIYQAD